jgi:hypothetical protein
MDNWDTDSEGRYGADNDDAVTSGLVLDRLNQTASGSDIPFISQTPGVDALPRLFARWITELPNEPFTLIRSIRVIVEEAAPQEFIASFREANIAMSGQSIEHALQNLTADILNAYEDLTEERPEMLGPGPRQQLEVLRTYLRSR